ncbi:MAG: Unknown protein [uncultured Sulfurovum sp.]|uniref:Malate dehydrogenase n=1 Tax=uncultured Sulfurovum sp. TaxID=269237 RepID=A0A6S6SNC9_9BACT|nr:MAG: Unknown protein [uncultured Sulfurovum sp.]
MGKKKQSLDFSAEDISFTMKEQKIKVLSLNQNSMDVEVIIFEGEKKKVSKMAFAHLPKEIKKLLRPI